MLDFYQHNNFYQIFLWVLILKIVLVVFQNNVDAHGQHGSELKDRPPLKVNLTTDLNWIEKSLQRHNYYRSLHNSVPLTHNKTLSEMSQSWANYMLKRALKSLNQTDTIDFFEHNYKVMDETHVGENLYYIAAYYGKLPPSHAVNLWYNEIKDYNFTIAGTKESSASDSLIGHFTQLVWNSSTQFGTALASKELSNKQVLTFVAAYYHPRGNLIISDVDSPMDLFLENVAPPMSHTISLIDENEKDIISHIERMGLKMKNLTTPGSWIEAGLAKHNDIRIVTGVPEIFISDELCRLSQYWSHQLLRTGLEEFNDNYKISYHKHSNATIRATFGENLMYFLSFSNDTDLDASIPVTLWHSENKFYDFKTKSTNASMSKTAKTHHFEQIIWKSTTHMGIAYSQGQAENGQYLTFVVANYYPSAQGSKSKKEKNENIPTRKNSGCGKTDTGILGTSSALSVVVQLFGYYMVSLLIH